MALNDDSPEHPKCDQGTGGVISYTFINPSDIKGYDEKGMPIMKRKYGKFTRAVSVYTPKKMEIDLRKRHKRKR